MNAAEPPPAGEPLPAAEPLLEEAIALAKAAGAMTRKWFPGGSHSGPLSGSLTTQFKPDGTEVSEADLAVEQYLRDELAERFPQDTVMGEEFGGELATSGRTWIIDPIDGTRGFVRGVPLYATLLALVDESGPLLGVIDLPALEQTLAAGRGIGCWLDQERCQVSETPSIKKALINTSDFATFSNKQFAQLHDAGAMLRTWGDAYGYFMVATGAADAMIDPICEAWDLAPMPVIIGEAGGMFTDLAGADSYTSRNGVATNGHIHQPVLAALGGAGAGGSGVSESGTASTDAD